MDIERLLLRLKEVVGDVGGIVFRTTTPFELRDRGPHHP